MFTTAPLTRIPAWLIAILALLAPLLVSAVQDSAPRFALPIACTVGKDCFVQNHVDHDSGTGYKDYRCGPLSYDRHTGTDIRLRHLAAMEQGVPVLAAAAGRVKALRDGMEDVNVRQIGYERIKGKDAGNTVLLEHANGWTSLYGHMRRGSVAVKQGELISQGQKLGLVGLSGNTEFPHVHFELKHNGKLVDPFTADDRDDVCGVPPNGLWDDTASTALQYRPTDVINAGFAAGAPSLAEVMAGHGPAYTPLNTTAPALLFWVNTFGMRAGDIVEIRLSAPDGSVLAEKRDNIPRDKADWLSYVGRRAHGQWPVGEYLGVYRILRNGKETEEVLRIERSLHLAPR